MILLMMVDTPEEKRKFVILYENYRYLMLKVAVDILHDYQLAEDAVQEAFVRVAKHMENVGQPEETATKRYLIMITNQQQLIFIAEETGYKAGKSIWMNFRKKLGSLLIWHRRKNMEC